MNLPETYLVHASRALTDGRWDAAMAYGIFAIALSMQPKVSMDFADKLIATADAEK